MLTYEFIDPDVQLSSPDFNFVEKFLRETGRTELGWHYITDIVWMYQRFKGWDRNFRILDAGGGGGPIQFLLAEMGFNVTNVDLHLPPVPASYRHRYRTTRSLLASFVPTKYNDFLENFPAIRLRNRLIEWIRRTSFFQNLKANRYARLHDKWRANSGLAVKTGEIHWVVGNLCNMPEIANGTFDAVVSLSAWEHIPIALLNSALKEIRRVLKPEARWAVTTSATETADTKYHEPSLSQCFSEEDLKQFFGASPASSETSLAILKKYQNCTYLQQHLAAFYKNSGKNGMPWGKWDPQYIPVGLGSPS